MTAAFVPFLYELRARKVKVGAQEALALASALVGDGGARSCSADALAEASAISPAWFNRGSERHRRIASPTLRAQSRGQFVDGLRAEIDENRRRFFAPTGLFVRARDEGRS